METQQTQSNADQNKITLICNTNPEYVESPLEYSEYASNLFLPGHRDYTFGHENLDGKVRDFAAEIAANDKRLKFVAFAKAHGWTSDEHATPDEIADELDIGAVTEWVSKEHNPKTSIVREVFCYIHGNISISLAPYSCPWDSGRLGITFMTPADIRKSYLCKQITAKVLQDATGCLLAEFKEYAAYVAGDYCELTVYGDPQYDGNAVNFNFYGRDALKTEVIENYGEAAYAAMLYETEETYKRKVYQNSAGENVSFDGRA